MRRWLPFLLFGLVLIGIAVALSSYADDQAELIVTAAPSAEEEPVDPAEQAACERARARYDVVWDESIENADDEEAEEKLAIALGEVIDRCGGE